MLASPCRDPRFKGGVLRCVAWNASSGVISVVAVVQLVRFGQLKVCQNRLEAFWCQSANFAYASQTCQAGAGMSWGVSAGNSRMALEGVLGLGKSSSAMSSWGWLWQVLG